MKTPTTDPRLCFRNLGTLLKKAASKIPKTSGKVAPLLHKLFRTVNSSVDFYLYLKFFHEFWSSSCSLSRNPSHMEVNMFFEGSLSSRWCVGELHISCIIRGLFGMMLSTIVLASLGSAWLWPLLLVLNNSSTDTAEKSMTMEFMSALHIILGTVC